ncbi:TonB-dependent receptor [Fulvivirgaceae bacterium BMA10]|uniref:TonB-dependent receptor n=1 Tax=Splendidivirga corallicola TaxID=3051826 RepID=A0ABT8KSN5_9BACT|nr:TonB-dependent receptor [Fulvivirgaceae bacterium BMA10]
MLIKRISLCIFLTVGSIVCIYAQSIEEIIISDSYQNQELIEIFNQIEASRPVEFFYKKNWISNIKISQKFENKKLTEFLDEILKDQKISYIIYNNNVVLLKGDISPEMVVSSSNNLPEAANYQVIGNALENPNNNEVIVSGFIKDAGNDDELIGARVFVEETENGSVTNVRGFYSVKLPPGKYTIRAGFTGYEEKKLSIDVRSNGTLNFDLFEETVELEEITITAEAQDENIKGVMAGKEKLSIEAIKGMPAFLGEIDVIKSIITLPGVSTVGEGASGFNVRGGGVGQNLLLQDDAVIYNASHLFGFFSSFNADLVRDVTLYKGGGPPNFGGRVSSILNVSTRNGNQKEFHGQGGIGLVSSRLVLEGPIAKNKTSFIIGGRSSYSDWILKRIKNADLQQSSAQFYDANLKISHNVNDKNKLIFSSYISNDRFKFSADTTYGWRTINNSLKWSHIFNEKLLSSISLSHGSYKNKTFDDQGFDSFTLRSSIENTGVKVDFNYVPLNKHKVDFGISATKYSFEPGDLVAGELNTNTDPVKVRKEQSIESGIYIKDEFQVNHKLSIMYGLRYSLFQNVGEGDVYLYDPNRPKEPTTILDTTHYSKGQLIKSYSGFEPRVSLRYAMGIQSSLKFSYYRTRQYVHLISNTTAVAPVDFWQSSNFYLEPQIGDQVSIGLFRNFKDNAIETSVEFYYKKIKNVIDYKDGASIILNETLEADLLKGSGRAYGVEVLLQKNKGKITGWLGYTYSKSERLFQSENEEEQINLGKYYPANYDKPHDLTLVFNYKASRRFKISANFTYSTGRPITVPVSKYSYDRILSVLNYSERNQFRIPDYHRLDLSVTLSEGHKKNKLIKGEWVFSVYNVYGRKNPYSVFFNQNGQAFRLAVLGSIFPSITYNFKF